MLGAVLALISAALFGYNNVATRRGVLNGTTIQGMAITVPMGAVLFAVVCLLTDGFHALAAFSWQAYACFAAAGIAHFVFGRYCNYRAIAAIGTNLASPIQQLEVLVTLALALTFLGERLSPVMIVAIVLLLLGPALATGMDRQSAGDTDRKPTFKPRYAEGYAYAFLTIFGYGSSPIFVRAGLESAGPLDSFAAGLISYVAAAIVVVVIVVALGQVRHVAAVGSEPLGWFGFAGLLVFLSQMCRYMALALIPVSVVAPIMRVQVLFRIYFAWLFAREHEAFDANVIAGTVISMLGAILLTLQVEAYLSTLALPDWVIALLGWQWP